MAYGGRPLWPRSLRSSLRTGKPFTATVGSITELNRAKAGRCFDDPRREVRKLRNAETILGIIREHGSDQPLGAK